MPTAYAAALAAFTAYSPKWIFRLTCSRLSMSLQPGLFTAASERATRTVLITDVARFTQLAQEDERDTMQRWQRLEDEVRNDVLPDFSGRLLETRGDCFVLEFPDALNAVKAAFAVRRACRKINGGVP